MTHSTHFPLHDVIVAGAGPVGLFLSCELALAGCSVRVLDQAAQLESPLKRLPFGIRGLSAPSIEALDRRGLLDPLDVPRRLKNPFAGATSTPASATPPAPARKGGHFAGLAFNEDDIDGTRWEDRLPSSTEPQLIAEMEELETVLARRAQALGVEIRRGCAVTGVHQSPDAVMVEAGGQSFDARWLVGCDGGRSAVRKTGGFDFPGTEPEFTGYSVRADLADPDKLPPGRVLTPGGMVFQSQPGFLVLQDFDGGAGHRPDAPPTPQALQALLRRISGTDVTLTALHHVTTWTDRARQATDYRMGRILLAGDAAHIHSPLGGQGLNLGLGDAMNLGWKLAAVCRGGAPDGLLDSYQAERHPLGAQVLDWSRAQVAVMRPNPAGRALRAILQDLMCTRDGATYFAGRVWGMWTRYDLGGGHRLAGRSVPNFAFADGSTLGARMRDGGGLLLDFEARPVLAAIAAAHAGLRYLSDPVQMDLGLGAVLVRPDGIVAWACDTEAAPDVGALRRAAARWFAPASGRGSAKPCDGSVSVDAASR